MRSFNAAAPQADTTRLTETVELGWEHTISGDSLVYTLDADGRHVPRRYTVPATLTAADLMRAAKVLPGDVSARLARGEIDLEVAVELVGSVIGGDVIESVAADPTVSSEALLGFVTWCLQLWGVAGSEPGEVAGDGPFVPASEG